MKKYKLIITSLFLLVSIFAHSQEENLFVVLDTNVEPLKCSYSSSREVERTIKSSLKDNAVFISNSNINTLEVSFEIVSSNLLEGMDTYYYSKLKTNVLLKSNINGLEKSIILETEGKGKNECSSLLKAYKSAFKGKNKLVLLEMFEEFNNNNFESFCSSIISKCNSLISEKEYHQALTILCKIPEKQSCSNDLISLREKIEGLIAEQNCEKEIHELTLIINSGDVGLIKKNIYRLLRIPPNAVCADEAIELSNKIGEKLENSNHSDLDKFNLIIENKNVDLWRQTYIRNN